MQLAFNTVLYRAEELDVALSEVRAAGYAGIELQPHLTLPLLRDEAAQGRLQRGLAREGLAAAAVMAGYLDDEAALARNAEAAALAARFGAAALVILPPKPGTVDTGEFEELLARLGEICASHAVRTAVHHHAGTVLDTPERIDAFVAARERPAVGLCFDLAHYALFADDLTQAAARLAQHVAYVHVKDLALRSSDLAFVPGLRNAQQAFRVIGDGVLDIGPALRALRDGGYDGWLSVEVENFYRGRVPSAHLSKARLEEAFA